MASRFSLDQYAQAMRSLLPRGRVWQREPSLVLSRVIRGLVAIFQQTDNDAQQLLTDAFPSTASALLPEWNATCGIPRPCTGPPSSIEQNQQQIVSLITATGGQSIPYITAIAKNLGFDIIVTEYSAEYPGTNQPAGFINKASDWNYTWSITVYLNAVGLKTVSDPVSQPLAKMGIKYLSCMIDTIKPAHTQVFYIVSTVTKTRLKNVLDNVQLPLVVLEN